MLKSIASTPITAKERRIRREIAPKLHLAYRAHAVTQHLNLRAATEQLIQAGFLAYRLDQWYKTAPYEAAGRGIKLISIALNPKIYSLVEIYRQEHPCSVRYAIEFLIKQGLAAWYKVHKLKKFFIDR